MALSPPSRSAGEQNSGRDGEAVQLASGVIRSPLRRPLPSRSPGHTPGELRSTLSRIPRAGRARTAPREPAGGLEAASLLPTPTRRAAAGRPPIPLGPPCDFETGAPVRSLETVTPPASSRERRPRVIAPPGALARYWLAVKRWADPGGPDGPQAESPAWRSGRWAGWCPQVVGPAFV